MKGASLEERCVNNQITWRQIQSVMKEIGKKPKTVGSFDWIFFNLLGSQTKVVAKCFKH